MGEISGVYKGDVESKCIHGSTAKKKKNVSFYYHCTRGWELDDEKE